jgi:peptide/nickel transport system substrate-binding protein
MLRSRSRLTSIEGIDQMLTRTAFTAALLATSALAVHLFAAAPAEAQTRAETLRHVTGAAINTLDPTMPGSTREAFGLSLLTYDRLVSFGRKQLDGKWVFDLDTIRGELAERFEVSPDGLTITFHLRRDAKFHDGSPVTAEDVKWSLDRAVSARSLAPGQMLTGSITKPEQFTIIDPHTVRLTLPVPDKLALPNLATIYPIIINSKLAKANATAADPWAQEWMKTNTAGSGAYIIESFRPGETTILRRNDDWRRGPNNAQAHFRRIITQTVPEAATRANLVERGDADIAIDLQASDAAELERKGRLKVVSTPQYNAITFVSFNTTMAPFDNPGVRRAIAAALPYEDMFKAALFERGKRLYGATWPGGKAPTGDTFPIVQPLKTDLAEARRLLTEAGFPSGFSTTLSFNVGQAGTADPMAALIKESLGRIGINVDIQKLPDAQMSTLINEKKVPFFIEGIVAWLPSMDYFYRNFYIGPIRWNYSSLNDPQITEWAQAARFEASKEKYAEYGVRLNTRHFELMPQIPLWQPSQDAVMATSIDGYTYQFHRQIDFRDLRRN